MGLGGARLLVVVARRPNHGYHTICAGSMLSLPHKLGGSDSTEPAQMAWYPWLWKTYLLQAKFFDTFDNV